MVKNLPAMQEAWLRSLGGEDPLEQRKATHSSILAWRIPRTEEPGRLQSMGLQRIGKENNTFITFTLILMRATGVHSLTKAEVLNWGLF